MNHCRKNQISDPGSFHLPVASQIFLAITQEKKALKYKGRIFERILLLRHSEIKNKVSPCVLQILATLFLETLTGHCNM